MSHRKRPVRRPKIGMKEAEGLVHALKTHQVDGIVGERRIMICRLKEVEEALENSRDQLRALTEQLQFTRENERAVIAREIHDELGQALAGLELGLSWLARKATPKQQPLQKKIGSLSALVTTMIQSIQRIVDGLRPGVLDELGLVKALQAEAGEFIGHSGIPCVFVTNMGKAKISRAGSIAIFRVVQAALTNIARHARASSAMVALRKSKSDLTLTVKDNGKGIRAPLLANRNSLGIIGMRERVIALDGTLSLSGSRGQGTTLTVRIPLSQVLIGKGGKEVGERSGGRDRRRNLDTFVDSISRVMKPSE
jgi:signal transduction histidine kinase